jgi:membrane protein DedA with SNARE-associated domain
VSAWIIDLIDQSGYLGIFFLMFLETVFPPIPSEVIMPVAGLAAARGKMDIVPVIASGTAGAMFGNYAWYLAARLIDISRFRSFIDRFGRWLTLNWAEIERAEKLFGTRGGAIVCVGRMLPTLRSIISIPAGLLKMQLFTFMIWSTLGTMVWTTGLAVAGYILGHQFDHIETVIGPLSTAVIAAIIIAYLWRLWRWRPSV